MTLDDPMSASTATTATAAAAASAAADMTFCMPSYARESLKTMFSMRSHQMLTDVVLEVREEQFHAHKIVLSAASSYFRAMFTGGLRETEMSRVRLQGVCPTAMGRILYFMYSGHIRVTELTVCQLLPAATMFQVQNVIDACCAFLERQLDPTNAIGIASFAEQHGCTKLKQRAQQFIERHFTQICVEEEFLQLTVVQLIQLIVKDELNVQEEREVYNAVLKWVKYDEDVRYPKMEHILHAVRCQLLTPNFLKEQMSNCDVLKKAPACREYLAAIFKDLTLHKRAMVRERKPNATRMIFTAGGYYRHSMDILEAFNVDDQTWTALPGLRVPRSGLGAAFLRGQFYAVGGRNNSPGTAYDSDWVDRYDPVTEEWQTCAPMTLPRNRVGVAVMDDMLYAVGGSSGTEYHDSVEQYEPDLDRWTRIRSMHFQRLGVGIAVVNRLLYAVGGFNGKERLKSCECYHPENDEWTLIPPMNVGRSGAGVAALNQYIYVVGGFDGSRQLNSVERYDTERCVWEIQTGIDIARSALALNVLDGKLYAMGGFDGQNFLSIVEVYDPVLNKWDEGTPLTTGRSGHASAVIYHPAGAAPSSNTSFNDYGAQSLTKAVGDKLRAQSPDQHDQQQMQQQTPQPLLPLPPLQTSQMCVYDPRLTVHTTPAAATDRSSRWPRQQHADDDRCDQNAVPGPMYEVNDAARCQICVDDATAGGTVVSTSRECLARMQMPPPPPPRPPQPSPAYTEQFRQQSHQLPQPQQPSLYAMDVSNFPASNATSFNSFAEPSLSYVAASQQHQRAIRTHGGFSYMPASPPTMGMQQPDYFQLQQQQLQQIVQHGHQGYHHYQPQQHEHHQHEQQYIPQQSHTHQGQHQHQQPYEPVAGCSYDSSPNDKKRSRVDSFNSIDALPAKMCPANDHNMDVINNSDDDDDDDDEYVDVDTYETYSSQSQQRGQRMSNSSSGFSDMSTATAATAESSSASASESQPVGTCRVRKFRENLQQRFRALVAGRCPQQQQQQQTQMTTDQIGQQLKPNNHDRNADDDDGDIDVDVTERDA